MAFVVKFVKTIRNNWKKSVVFTGLVAYGINYANGVYEDSLIRRAYCEEAKKYGSVPLRTGESAQRVTVFLNPAAKKGKAKKLFDKNVAPILNLAGLELTVVRTEYEGQAKQYMDVLEATDAIIVAGGDGTLAEVVTGLLRRKDEANFSKIPIGVIPLGFTNTLAAALFEKDKSDAKWMLDAALSVVRGTTKPVDVLGITGDEGKTVFAVHSLEWGSFKEAQGRAKKYWYFGPLKKRWTYLMSVLGEWPPLVHGLLSYQQPCEGCSRCYQPPPKPQWKWWHIFLPPKVQVPVKDYSLVSNDDCGVEHRMDVSTVELQAKTHNTDTEGNLPLKNRGMKLTISPEQIDKSDFIKEGWARNKGQHIINNNQEIEVQKFTLRPEGKQSHDFYIIDNEQYENMTVCVELLRDKLQMFCPPST